MSNKAVSYIGDYPVEVIKNAGGDALVGRFLKKISGSDANKDGRDFELTYGVVSTTLELAKIYVRSSRGGTVPDLYQLCFWDRPISLVDDFYMYGIEVHYFAQLKRGGFKTGEIMSDIALQKEMDWQVGNYLDYHIVLGHQVEVDDLAEELRRRGWEDVACHAFCHTTEFCHLIEQFPPLGAALGAITGSMRLLEQETAYETLFYQYWKTSYLQQFVRHAAACAARKDDYIPPLVRPSLYDDLEFQLGQCLTGGEARIVGQMLRLRGRGVLQTYLLPSDSHLDQFIRWLDEGEVDFETLIEELGDRGWQRAVR